ncbi:hypothetical protein KIN20_032864 [Parelaphostrongylus tenuis]|uniref:Uncharacterized protein n=1 Tax=Parelaphostrongylus tenuis TaxID=148309 RepID=A0AAD5WIT1_PARTN|nr:hypothetical protein KIN20_032864 [Parelaphostrongylus tenuis]
MLGGWECPYCTLVNNQSNTICTACGSERDRGGGRSPLISKFIIKPIADVANALLEFINGSSNPPITPRQCTPCSILLPGSSQNVVTSPETVAAPSSTTDQESSYWICRNCSNVNNDVAMVCAQCSQTKPIGSKRRLRGQDRSATLGLNGRSYHSTNSLSAQDTSVSLCSEVMTEVERCDRDNAAATYNAIVVFCQQNMTSFIDDSFPHSPASIGDIRCVDGAVVGKVPKSFLWLRPEQMYTKDGRTWPWTVFRDPRSSDIEQGCLGDCWLLSAMALIAERPDILEHILLTKEYSHVGAYQVRLCIDGRWKIVIVDDFFPCRIETRSIAFADGRKNQLWVPLIEKALAKQLGSYSRLLAGRTIEGLSILTGASVEMISLEDDDNSDKDLKWTRILSAKEAGFIMGCSCGAGKRVVDSNVFQRKGLLARHAYSILEVKQEGEYRLLKLRNPWGTFVWNGKWSNNWKGWPKELKRKLLSGEPSTGTFWISYDDFLLHFDAVDIAKIRCFQGWAELRIPMQMGGTFLETDKAIRILIEEPTEVCFTLFQSGARTARDQADLFICVHMISPSGAVGELVHRSPRKIEPFVDTGDMFLRSGQYIVEGTIHHSMTGVYPRYITNDFAGLLLMVDNSLDDMWVHVKAECSNSLNVLSSRGVLDVADSIPPLSRQIIMVLTHFEPTQSFLVQHQLTRWETLPLVAMVFDPSLTRIHRLLIILRWNNYISIKLFSPRSGY